MGYGVFIPFLSINIPSPAKLKLVKILYVADTIRPSQPPPIMYRTNLDLFLHTRMLEVACLYAYTRRMYVCDTVYMNTDMINELNAEIDSAKDKLAQLYAARIKAINIYYGKGYSVSEIGRSFNMKHQNVSKIVSE